MKFTTSKNQKNTLRTYIRIFFSIFFTVACNCNNNYSRGVGCNVLTGQCECLPGVIGEKCDSCPYRWVLVPDKGCNECDKCHHSLLDVTDGMANDLDPVINEFETVAMGSFTSRKLNYFNELTDSMEPDIKKLDPNSVNLAPMGQKIDSLEVETKNLERKLKYVYETVSDSSDSQWLNDSRSILSGTRKTLENIQNTVYEVQKLADSFDASGNTKADISISEAKNILDHIENFDIDTVITEKELENSLNYLSQIEDFIAPVKMQDEKLNKLHGEIKLFNDKLNDLKNRSKEAIKTSLESDKLQQKNENASVNIKLETVNNHTKETQNNIETTLGLKKDGDIILGEIYHFLRNLENINNELNVTNTQVDKDLPSKEKEYNNLDDIIAQAVNHRSQLAERVIKLNFLCVSI